MPDSFTKNWQKFQIREFVSFPNLFKKYMKTGVNKLQSQIQFLSFYMVLIQQQYLQIPKSKTTSEV